MTFGDLREKASSDPKRHLYRVKKGGVKEALPTFRLLNITELENVLRKAKKYQNLINLDKIDFDDEGNVISDPGSKSRVKQKSIVLKTSMTDQHFHTHTAKVKSWLARGRLVHVKIEKSGSTSDFSAEARKMKERLEKDLEETFREFPASREMFFFKTNVVEAPAESGGKANNNKGVKQGAAKGGKADKSKNEFKKKRK